MSVINKNFNPNLQELYDLLNIEIINSLLEGQYEIVSGYNNTYSLRLAKGFIIDVIVNIDVIHNKKIIYNNRVTFPDLTKIPYDIGEKIVDKLNDKSKEREVMKMEEEILKLQQKINNLKKNGSEQ